MLLLLFCIKIGEGGKLTHLPIRDKGKNIPQAVRLSSPNVFLIGAKWRGWEIVPWFNHSYTRKDGGNLFLYMSFCYIENTFYLKQIYECIFQGWITTLSHGSWPRPSAESKYINLKLLNAGCSLRFVQFVYI